MPGLVVRTGYSVGNTKDTALHHLAIENVQGDEHQTSKCANTYMTTNEKECCRERSKRTALRTQRALCGGQGVGGEGKRKYFLANNNNNNVKGKKVFGFISD